MNQDLFNILSNSNKDIDNQKLMDYLAGKLSDQEKHEVESWLVDNEFANDAVEGLEKMPDKKNIDLYVDQLNKELNQYIQKKKQRRRRRGIQKQHWTLLAIVLIVILAILGYVVIKMAKHP